MHEQASDFNDRSLNKDDRWVLCLIALEVNNRPEGHRTYLKSVRACAIVANCSASPKPISLMPEKGGIAYCAPIRVCLLHHYTAYSLHLTFILLRIITSMLGSNAVQLAECKVSVLPTLCFLQAPFKVTK